MPGGSTYNRRRLLLLLELLLLLLWLKSSGLLNPDLNLRSILTGNGRHRRNTKLSLQRLLSLKSASINIARGLSLEDWSLLLKLLLLRWLSIAGLLRVLKLGLEALLALRLLSQVAVVHWQ